MPADGRADDANAEVNVKMSVFFNKRIEAPFGGAYKGYNQFLFTGGVDDLFLMDSSATGRRPTLCRIKEALLDFGKKNAYDIVVVVKDIAIKENKKLEFPFPGHEERFNLVAKGNSAHLAEPGHTVRAHVPVGQRSAAASASSATSHLNTDERANQTARQTISEVSGQAKGNDASNILGQITRVLQKPELRTLVVFPDADTLIPQGGGGGEVLDKMRVVVKDWRDIIQTAHPDTRTVLIVNPHRLKEFHMMEQQLSCFDHNCKEIVVGSPPVEEMRAWLEYYRSMNGIRGTPCEGERVVLTGKAGVGGNLQNFVCWVQSFYQKHPTERTWSALLASEGQDAAESKEDLLEELKDLKGLDNVKTEIKAIVREAERDISAASERAYHMFFLGNPGTGKTVVANIVAKLFWAMELRTSKKVVSITIQDIVSQYNEGDTIQKMKSKVAEAMGGVLFIDEAYMFAESDWGRKAFQTLLTEMENNRKNLTVILAGYEDRLQKVRDINPGIDSRIPYKLKFDDYSKEDKLRIFKSMLVAENRKANIERELTPGAEAKLMRVLDGCDSNGRGVRNVLEKTLKTLGGETVIDEKHIIDPHATNRDKAEELLAEIDRDFIGMESMKRQLRKYFRNVEWEQERNQKLGLARRGGHAYRIRFTGPPGTGKTSIARYMGKFFHAMGICETDQCVECGATSLKGAYIGHAQQAVNNLFHENRGKVIFIDEIYSLYNPQARQDDSFSREVIDTLVRCLTAEEYQNTVLIVAGYKDKVDQFMQANPGLASRIPDEIVFENYTPEDCVKILRLVAEKDSYVLSPECEEPLRRYFDDFMKHAGDDFGNARDVKVVYGEVISRMSDRLAEKADKTESDYRNILPDDIPCVENAETMTTDGAAVATAEGSEVEHE